MKEAILHRVVEGLKGRTTLVEAPLPKGDVESATAQAVDVFKSQTKDTTSPLQVQDRFGKWVDATGDTIADEIGEYLANLDRNNRRLDACRGVSDLKIVVSRRRRLGLLIDVTATEYTGLGDGCAAYTTGEGWSVTQRKGTHTTNSHLLIRENRRKKRT